MGGAGGGIGEGRGRREPAAAGASGWMRLSPHPSGKRTRAYLWESFLSRFLLDRDRAEVRPDRGGSEPV